MLADGTADAAVRAMLSDPTISPADLARSLRSIPLLATVVAVLDEADEADGDKGSHMAVVSMVSGSGQRGLLAFSGMDSLRRWNANARPVPALGRDLARAALDDGADALVIDVLGPCRAVLSAGDLSVLADTLDLPTGLE